MDVWELIGSKWTMLILAILLGLALPVTYHNAKVVLTFEGNVPTVTLVSMLVVFAFNALGALGALYKFVSSFRSNEVKLETTNE